MTFFIVLMRSGTEKGFERKPAMPSGYGGSSENIGRPLQKRKGGRETFLRARSLKNSRPLSSDITISLTTRSNLFSAIMFAASGRLEAMEVSKPETLRSDCKTFKISTSSSIRRIFEPTISGLEKRAYFS